MRITPSASLPCQPIWEKHRRSAHHFELHDPIEHVEWLQMFCPLRAHFNIQQSTLEQSWGCCIKVCWLASPRCSAGATCQVQKGAHSFISLLHCHVTYTCYRTDDGLVIQCDPICQIKMEWKQQLVATPKISFESLSL